MCMCVNETDGVCVCVYACVHECVFACCDCGVCVCERKSICTSCYSSKFLSYIVFSFFKDFHFSVFVTVISKERNI